MYLKIISGAGPDFYTETASLLYGIAAHRPLPNVLPPLPLPCFASVVVTYWGAKQKLPLLDMVPFQSLSPSVLSGSAIIGATGGKDSLAVAVKLLREGIRPVFVHILGINPVYAHERRAAEKQASVLGCQFILVKVKIGKKLYVENPMRNTAMFLLLASVAAQLGIDTVLMGLHAARTGATYSFDSGWSDCCEMADASKEMLFGLAPWLTTRLDRLPIYDTASLKYLLKHRPDLIPLVQSCMLPVRYLPTTRAANCRKAGYELLPNRCGSCHKCCREWLVLNRAGVMPRADIYERHVKKRLLGFARYCFGPTSDSWTSDQIIAEFTRES